MINTKTFIISMKFIHGRLGATYHHGNQPLMGKPFPLNSKQQKFAEIFAAGETVTQAAIQAGYAPNSAKVTGSRLLAQEKVHAEVVRLQQRAADSSVVTIKWITGKFLQVAMMAMSKGDLANANRALENLARHKGYFEQDNLQSAPVIQIGMISQDALQARLDELESKQDTQPVIDSTAQSRSME